MDDQSRLQLQQMIQANNVEDQTQLIRELKHSVLLRADINQLLKLKATYGDDQNMIIQEGMNDCSFLFTYYTDIFNKIRKDEIDIKILFYFIDVLKKIENGELDQHEGSFLVGKILKEMYVDSALKKAEKLNKSDQEKEKEKEEELKEERKGLPILWKQWKQTI
jgi:hypothetical protein